jgi:CBS domain-containing protein
MVSKIGALKIMDVASTTFTSLDENVLVADAAKTLYEQDACSIIVTRKDANSETRIPVGIITERDMIFRVIAQNKGPFKLSLKDIMSSPLITIDSEKTVKDALAVLKTNKINRIAVISKNGELIGFVSTEMLAKKLPIDRVTLT